MLGYCHFNEFVTQQCMIAYSSFNNFVFHDSSMSTVCKCLMSCCFTVLLQEPFSKAALPTKKQAISASKNGTATGPVVAAKKAESSDSSSSDSSDNSDSDELVSFGSYLSRDVKLCCSVI